MTAHKVRVRRWRGVKEMGSLRAFSYPAEGAYVWWMTCNQPGCRVNRGTWATSWLYAVNWGLKHRADPEDWRP